MVATKIIHPNGEIEFGLNNERPYSNKTVRKILNLERTKEPEDFNFGNHCVHVVHTIMGTYIIILTEKL